MPEEDLVELKFRIYDGSDIGPFRYSPASTVAMVKEKIVTEWPKADLQVNSVEGFNEQITRRKSRLGRLCGRFSHKKSHFLEDSCGQYLSGCLVASNKKIVPKGANDVKLINAGKVLENNKTVGQCRVPFGELPRGVITMHAVVQPSLAKAKTEKKVDEAPRKSICSCSIL